MKSSHSNSIVSQILSRHISHVNNRKSKRPSNHLSPETSNHGYNHLIKKSYESLSFNCCGVLNTGGEYFEMNPVYDLKYSPKAVGSDGDYSTRLIGVGDERGFLRVVRVRVDAAKRGREWRRCGGVEGKNKKEMSYVVGDQTQVKNCGVTTFLKSSDGGEDDGYPDSGTINPVIYTLDWNESGEKILVGYGDGSIRVWDLGEAGDGGGGGNKRACVSEVHAYQKSIKRVVWGSESTYLSCSRTNEIRYHDNRMRNPTVNRIDCSASNLNCKLTDISLLDGGYHVASSSSNQSNVLLWDLRKSYKLLRRVCPVESFACGSNGLVCLKSERDYLYGLGIDGVVVRVAWRGGNSGSSSQGNDDTVFRGWRVPNGKVDFFSKIDMAANSNVLVCGGSGDSAWGFDLTEGGREGGLNEPFFELRGGRTVKWDEGKYSIDDANDKENLGSGSQGDAAAVVRSCSAVACGTLRGVDDCFFQVATGGDDSCVTVWD